MQIIKNTWGDTIGRIYEFADFSVGDLVCIKRDVRPQYLGGSCGQIVKKNSKKAKLSIPGFDEEYPVEYMFLEPKPN